METTSERPIRRRAAQFVWLTTCCLMAPACDSTTPTLRSFAARDSAGVRIVETAALDSSTMSWSVEPEPVLNLGKGEVEFGAVSHAVRLRNGTIVVGDRQSRQLYFIEETGQPLIVVGGRGEGPGEFSSITQLQETDSVVVVWDSSLRRFTFFSHDGRLLSTSSSGDDLWRSRQLAMQGWLGNNGLGVLSEPEGLPNMPMSRVSRPLLRFDREGRLVDTIAHVSALNTGTGPTMQSGVVYVTELPKFAFGREGVWLGAPYVYELRHLSSDGSLDRILRHAWEPQMLGPAGQEAVRARAAQALSPPGLPPELAESLAWTLENMVVRDSLPAYLDLKEDALGYLWVNEPESLDVSPPASWRSMTPESRRWAVFNPEGRWLGYVSMPTGLSIYDIGADYVLGLWRDELGVDHVRLHRLNRGAES